LHGIAVAILALVIAAALSASLVLAYKKDL
jgi:hypothetical protein